MARIEKTVFISYRRTNVPWALAIFQDLTQHGYDVFFDFSGLASGDFESVILENIHSRAHFLVLLTPSALKRCGDPSDWLRREIEAALDDKRNIVPLMLEGFDFGTPTIARQLTGKLAALKHYNALGVPPAFFFEAMGRLRDKFLNVPLDAVLQPASLVAQQAAIDEKGAAAKTPEVQSILQNLIESEDLTKDDLATLMQATSDPETLAFIIRKLRDAGADQIGSGKPLDISQYYRDGTDMFELRWPLQVSLPIAFDQLDRKTQFFVLFQEWTRRELDGMVALNSGATSQANAIFEECLKRAQQLEVNELIARSYQGFLRIAETNGDIRAVRKWSTLAVKARSANG